MGCGLVSMGNEHVLVLRLSMVFNVTYTICKQLELDAKRSQSVMSADCQSYSICQLKSSF